MLHVLIIFKVAQCYARDNANKDNIELSGLTCGLWKQFSTLSKLYDCLLKL